MRHRGVTLIELVVVIVVLTAGAALLGTSFLEPARSIADNENIQMTWRVAQACADHALGVRRISGTSGSYALVTSPLVPACPTLNSITPTIAVAATTNVGACSALGAGSACKAVTVTASKGGYTATLNFVVVDY
jgi:prepilin-type N-terminal cleavage/methylation domain-containing protein